MVMLEVETPSAVMVAGEAVIVEFATLAAPGVKVIASVSTIATPPIVPLIVLVPVVIEDVRIAVYVPLLLSTMLERVPNVLLRVKDAPPVVKLLPFISFSCTVIVEVLVPFATMTLGEAEISEVPALAGPGTKVTTSLSAIATPPTDPLMVDVPAVVVVHHR
jgi:hypothetical protein